MSVTLWGTRGSLAAPGPETARYGGNTSCVAVEGRLGSVLVLDAGTGVRRLGVSLPTSLKRVDILLTHLHMDHIIGLGFFALLRREGVDVHIWGPTSTTLSLRSRLNRYLSPPLFPVFLRDLEAQVTFHEVPAGHFEIGEFEITSALVCHPDPTVGYRVCSDGAVLTYLPDHEPALGSMQFPLSDDWTSGHALAAGADLLIHDAQYNREEYEARVGWGHSSFDQAFAFAALTEVKHFVPFHHDPSHSDDELDFWITEATAAIRPLFAVTPGIEGTKFALGR
ncbi:MAG: MBL fold metallo-hydrolase [Chloroflexi bacterium]|nr:MBL fold metallo-hydrolase [Chloroflexota bacterium]